MEFIIIIAISLRLILIIRYALVLIFYGKRADSSTNDMWKNHDWKCINCKTDLWQCWVCIKMDETLRIYHHSSPLTTFHHHSPPPLTNTPWQSPPLLTTPDQSPPLTTTHHPPPLTITHHHSPLLNTINCTYTHHITSLAYTITQVHHTSSPYKFITH